MANGTELAPRQRIWLPLVFLVALAALGFWLTGRQEPGLSSAFGIATALLVAWWAALAIRAHGKNYSIEIRLMPQHYLQAIAHASILIYWGVYWAPMRDAAPLIVAQIIFAYAFDMLLSFSRRRKFVLGFGPFPIIFSINLFLRFRDEWFIWQFAMIALGLLAKEFITWQRDGRRGHIFNPSSLPLAVVSFVLLATGASALTWGADISSELFLPPHIFLFIFLVSLPGQFKFGVTSMTLPAVLATYAFSYGYFKLYGTYFFIDDNIPIAVFLGMHLLFTDPATSPRTELGRMVYGVIYGLGVVAAYAVLGHFGAPTFYDKLLPVPFMNLMVKGLDAAARSRVLRWLDISRVGSGLSSLQRRAAFTALWVVAFSSIAMAGGLGDLHPGHHVPFWSTACADGRHNGCRGLEVIEQRYCTLGSAWACNDAGVNMAAGKFPDSREQASVLATACTIGLTTACDNLQQPAGTPLRRADPSIEDYALLLREGKGPIAEEAPRDIYKRACNQGWVSGCGNLGLTMLMSDAPDKPAAVSILTDACDRHHGMSCFNLAVAYRNGDGAPKDQERAMSYLKRACDLGTARACALLASGAR